MVQGVKLLLTTPVSHFGGLIEFLTAVLPIHVLVTASRKEACDGPVECASVTHVKNRMDFVEPRLELMNTCPTVSSGWKMFSSICLPSPLSV